MYKGKVLSPDWQLTAEGETVLQNFYDPQTAGRKLFGLLEKPISSTVFEEHRYKIFVSGKAGVGKSATTARLAGSVSGTSAYIETAGIRQTNIYWPARIREKIILFKLQFWDAGDNSIKKYSHILPACLNKVDAVLFVFSFTDQTSLSELPQQMSKVMQKADSNPTCIAIGTRYNVSDGAGEPLAVGTSEVREFEQKWHIPVLRIDNSYLCEISDEVHHVASLLNIICTRLLIRSHYPQARPSTIR